MLLAQSVLDAFSWPRLFPLLEIRKSCGLRRPFPLPLSQLHTGPAARAKARL